MSWTSLVWWKQRLRTFPTTCSSTCHMASTGDIEGEMFTRWCPGKHLLTCWPPEDTTRALDPDRRMGWVWERTIKMMRTSVSFMEECILRFSGIFRKQLKSRVNSLFTMTFFFLSRLQSHSSFPAFANICSSHTKLIPEMHTWWLLSAVTNIGHCEPCYRASSNYQELQMWYFKSYIECGL